jgi:ribosome-associated heat shock protein Hsp15
MLGVRIDKFLWAARFFKTRSLAQEAVEHGRVLLGGERVKVAREVRAGDTLRIRIGDSEKTVSVLDVSDQRSAAPIAQLLYRETEESIKARVAAAAARVLASEPAREIVGRPTKRDRRDLDRWTRE